MTTPIGDPAGAGAALPWGDLRSSPTGSRAPRAAQTAGAASPGRLADGLVGATVEVLWVMEGEDGEREERWWGAVVEAPPDAAGGVIHTLRYDADEGEGYPSEARAVVFAGDHEVLDLHDGEVMCWRLVGDDWEPSDAEGHGEGGTGGETGEGETGGGGAGERRASPTPSAPREGVRLSDLAAAVRAQEDASGRSLEESCAEALECVPAPLRSLVASGFRDFADALRDRFDEVSRTRDPGAALTAENVREIARDVGRALRGGGREGGGVT